MTFEYLLIEPEYAINLGAIARVLMNFGVKRIHIVNPKVSLDDPQVIMFAKRAYPLIKKAKIYDTVDDAIKKIKPKLIIGTTGVKKRFRRGIMRKVIPLPEAREKVKRKGKILILFGREGTGLNKYESSLCHFFVMIPTCDAYPVMNLSHAVAVVAYEMENIKWEDAEDIGDIEQLCATFNMFVDTVDMVTDVRKKDKIKQSFRNVVSRGLPAPKEAHSLIAILYRAQEVIETCVKKSVRKGLKKL